MAYRIVDQNPYTKHYVCDTEADVAKLPTTTRSGEVQAGIDSTTTLRAQAGSTAKVIATGDLYILQGDIDSWVKQPASGGGGSGTQGRDGLDVLYCKSIGVTSGVEATLTTSDFDIPTGRTLDVGDLCICKNGVVARITEIDGTDIKLLGLFQMTGAGYVASYQYTQAAPATEWVIQHNLGVARPTITCFDNDGNEIIGDYEFPDVNNVKVIFGIAVAGKAIVQG